MEDLSVLVCSCDKYEDLWNPMFEMFFKYWEDCPYKVYLMSNIKECRITNVNTIKTGKDKSWSNEFKEALSKIDSEYVFIIMEDYLLQEKVRNMDFQFIIEFMRYEKIDCFRTFPSPGPDIGYGKMDEFSIGLVDETAEYRICLQAAIWKKEYVLSIIDENDSAWQFEHLGSKRSQKDGSKIVSVCKDNKRLIFDYYCTGVIQGYWIKEAVQLCHENNVQVDLVKRPLETKYIRIKRLSMEKYFIGLRYIIKKTFIYDKYREKKYKVK